MVTKRHGSKGSLASTKNSNKSTGIKRQHPEKGVREGETEFPELNLEMPTDSESESDDGLDEEEIDEHDSDFDTLLQAVAHDQGLGSGDDSDDGYIEGDSVDEDEEDEESTNIDSETESGYLTKHSFKDDMDAWKNERKELANIDPVYDSDSSTEETTNTIGNVPIEWYADYPHIGYDIDGKKVLKPMTKDQLDTFLSNADDPDAFRTVRDELNQTDVRLTDKEVDLIKRIQSGQIPDAEYDPYEPTVEWFTSQKMITPLTGAPEPKSRFIPSKWEHKMVMKLVRAFRKNKSTQKPRPEAPKYYDIWAENEDQEQSDVRSRLPAPKMKLPDHSESYNPPGEYLLTAEEEKEWLETDPDERKRNFLPKAYNSLRLVPGYDRFVQERFQRLLDLYVAPRKEIKKNDIDIESLIPKLPDPRDLQPYPTQQSQLYAGHTGRVRSISVDPSGLWLLSGSDDKTVRLWEIVTGRCAQIWKFDDVVQKVAWNPDKDLCLFGVAAGDNAYIAIPDGLCDQTRLTVTEEFVKAGFGNSKDAEQTASVSWNKPTSAQQEAGIELVLQLGGTVKDLSWHKKGNYFSTMHSQTGNTAVIIHQISKHQSQIPFRKLKGLVQRTMFHPTKPWFIVVTQRYVRIYNLMQQELVKSLDPSAKWISSIDVHPQGDNVIVGTYDKKLAWFDLDLSTKPYKTIRYHTQAIRQVHFSRKYPLFASCSDDGTIQVFHGMVYQDLLHNPLVVPLKILRGHETVGPLGILDCTFHPTQPWLFSSGADQTIRLWT